MSPHEELQQQQRLLASLGYHVFVRHKGQPGGTYVLQTVTTDRPSAEAAVRTLGSDWKAKIVLAPKVMPEAGS